MSNQNVDIEANNANDIKIDPNVLKQIFGVPKGDTKQNGNHNRTNENAREGYPMKQPLLTTPKDRNESTPDGTKELPKAAQLPPSQPQDPNADHFQWWSSDDDHPPDQDDDGVAVRFGETLPAPVPTIPPTGTPDVNAYQQRKNLAHGMMDLALLSANATQLRSVLEAASHPYYYPSVAFVSLSIILQITVGILLILNSRYDVTKKSEIQTAIQVNDVTVVGVFLVTIINVFIASFIGASPTPASA